MLTHNQNPLGKTCASCSAFDDYHDERNRGWCRAFDKPARRHHSRTPECDCVQVQLVGVEVLSKELEMDDSGNLVPVESKVLWVKVNEVTEPAVIGAIANLVDLTQYELHSFWTPTFEQEF